MPGSRVYSPYVLFNVLIQVYCHLSLLRSPEPVVIFQLNLANVKTQIT